ncbi:hypothetical protein [Massilia sp. CCM 8734]|uniref:hypothetical protein n=1 Tax=Massilia sp. CCM 8734 TaxID=2609283 RepID=UPI00141EB60B|nr:hypothetical protein [Massilia sp. CCM 8734]NHZ99547.1 hypothetical protein [Massilia sp. CCM 8734]
MLSRIVIAGAVALCFSACTMPPTRVALDPAAKELTQVPVTSLLPQDEIIVRAEAFGAGAALGGGLIGAFIDSKVAESRQNTIHGTLAPFYASVDDYDFRSHYLQALAANLASGTPLKFGAVETQPMPSTMQQITDRVNAVGAGKGLMVIQTSYTFSPDFKQLSVRSVATLSRPNVEQKSFLNTYVFLSSPLGAGGTDSLKAWGENKGAAYRSASKDAIDNIMLMMKLDLMAGPADAADLPKGTIPMIQGVSVAQQNAPVLASGNGRAVLRALNGHLYSIAQ